MTGQYKEHTAILFDATWDRGLRFDLLRHPSVSEETSKVPEQRFHLFPPSEKSPEFQPLPPAAPPDSPDAKDGGSVH
jgi:hypothetical protein